MRTRSKLMLTAFTATVILAMALGSASARRIEVSEQRFRTVWSNGGGFTNLIFVAGGTHTASCPVTLEGSFHSKTLSKVCGQLVGYITRAVVAGCLGGSSATALTETLPWHIRYQSFNGTLPAISGVTIQLVNARFNIKPSGEPECLAGTTAANPARGIININGEGVATSLRADETTNIPLEGFFCEVFVGSGHFAGLASVKVLGSTTTNITARLVQ